MAKTAVATSRRIVTCLAIEQMNGEIAIYCLNFSVAQQRLYWVAIEAFEQHLIALHHWLAAQTVLGEGATLPFRRLKWFGFIVVAGCGLCSRLLCHRATE